MISYKAIRKNKTLSQVLSAGEVSATESENAAAAVLSSISGIFIG